MADRPLANRPPLPDRQTPRLCRFWQALFARSVLFRWFIQINEAYKSYVKKNWEFKVLGGPQATNGHKAV